MIYSLYSLLRVVRDKCIQFIIARPICQPKVGYIKTRGGISFNTAGSFSTALLWKLSPGKLQFPRTLNNIARKLGKNANLFYLNIPKIKQKKYHAFKCHCCGN